MASRGWGASIVTAVGVAAGTSAAQLGLGYGLGIVTWIPASAPEGETAWVGSLAWATWIAATSVIIGAICADRLAGSPGPESTVGNAEPWVGRRRTDRYGPLGTALWRIVLALAAAVGGALTVALVALPARSAVRADSFAPETIAGACAVVGVIGGLLLAFASLASAAVAANVFVTMGWLWLLAVAAVAHGEWAGSGPWGAQLAVWDFTSEGPWLRDLYVPGMLLSLVSALIIGAAAAWPAARREESRVGVAVSGAVGPLLVSMAYFLATPRLGGMQAEQFSTYQIAQYAVIAGLAGSVLVSGVGTARGQVSPAAKPGSSTTQPEPAGGDGQPTDGGKPTASAQSAEIGEASGSGQVAASGRPAGTGESSGSSQAAGKPAAEPAPSGGENPAANRKRGKRKPTPAGQSRTAE